MTEQYDANLKKILDLLEPWYINIAYAFTNSNLNSSHSIDIRNDLENFKRGIECFLALKKITKRDIINLMGIFDKWKDAVGEFGSYLKAKYDRELYLKLMHVNKLVTEEMKFLEKFAFD